MTYTCKILTPAQQEQLFADARAGITGDEAVAKYPVSRSTLTLLLKAHGLAFVRKPAVSDEEIVEALAAGVSSWVLNRTRGVSFDRVARIRADLGLPTDAELQRAKTEAMRARVVELAPSMHLSAIAAEVGLDAATVTKYLRDAGVRAAKFVRPVKPGVVRRAPRNPKPKMVASERPKREKAAPKTPPTRAAVARILRDPQPAPIKRPKRPKKQDPLFLTCSRKHPITRSNTVQGTEKECLICRKRGVNVSPALVYARERLIAELERQVAIEVAELTADLRPGMEKAA